MEAYQPPFTITNEMLSCVASISEKIGRITAISSLESKPHLRKINRHSPYLSITLHKCYPYYLFGISTFPSSVYHSIALRKFSITIV